MPDARDRLVAVALIVASAAELLLLAPGDESSVAAGAAFAIAALTAWRRTAPVVAGAATAAALAYVFARGVSPDDVPNTTLLAVGVTAYSVGARCTAVAGRLTLAALVLGGFVTQPLFADDWTPPLLFATTGPWVVGAIVAARRRLARRLEETVGALEAERAAYVALAVERERRAIARELHDIVGHAMSLIVIQATAGRHLVASDPAEAVGALEAIVDSGRQASVEVSRLRGVLSDEMPPDLSSLPALVARAAGAGLRVTVTGGARVVLDPEVEHAAFRVVQESLTNALKHAAGSEVSVDLDQDGPWFVVVVRNGAGHARPGAPGRMGLRGMSERVGELGGSLDAGRCGDGWRVEARLPCAAQPAASPASSRSMTGPTSARAAAGSDARAT